MTHMFNHPDPMLVATVNATSAEIEGEKASIANRRAKALVKAKEDHKTVVAVGTARRAVSAGQLPNTLAHEAMEASIAGMRAAKIARDKQRSASRRR